MPPFCLHGYITHAHCTPIIEYKMIEYFSSHSLTIKLLNIFSLYGYVAINLRSYSKSKLELKSNLSEILPVNCKFICDSNPLLSDKTQFEHLKFGFQCIRKIKIQTKICFHHSTSAFFEFSSSLLLENDRNR